MAKAAMTPIRALTIALNAALLEDGSLQSKAGLDHVSTAILAADTAVRALDHLPPGWAVVGRAAVAKHDADLLEQLRDISQRLAEFAAMNRFLLAARLVEDGHAKDLREASGIAKDLDKVRELYPQPDDES